MTPTIDIGHNNNNDFVVAALRELPMRSLVKESIAAHATPTNINIIIIKEKHLSLPHGIALLICLFLSQKFFK